MSNEPEPLNLVQFIAHYHCFCGLSKTSLYRFLFETYCRYPDPEPDPALESAEMKQSTSQSSSEPTPPLVAGALLGADQVTNLLVGLFGGRYESVKSAVALRARLCSAIDEKSKKIVAVDMNGKPIRQENGALSQPEFMAVLEKKKLYPCLKHIFRCQTHLRRLVMGQKWWHTIERKV